MIFGDSIYLQLGAEDAGVALMLNHTIEGAEGPAARHGLLK